jgi:hypothetical protein
MIGRDTTPGSGSRMSVRRLLSAVDALFPPGTPITSGAFLGAVASLLDADRAALVLTRLESSDRAMRVIDSVMHNAPAPAQERFADDTRNHRAWNRDLIATKLYDRCARRPWRHFSFSAYRWGHAHRLALDESFSLRLLHGMGVKRELTSVRPAERGIFALLSVYRHRDDAEPFTRVDVRTLCALHAVFAHRLIDARARGLRQELPPALQSTFSYILAGNSEKEIARLTHRSPNTVHDHVKRIYQHFGVSSRGQLLARFVSPELLQGGHAIHAANSGNGNGNAHGHHAASAAVAQALAD